MGDCRDCAHNTYRNIKNCDFVHCDHPITLARGPRWEAGDPWFVSWRTGDVHVREMAQFDGCPTHTPTPEKAP